MASRLNPVRTAAAVLGASAILLVTALPAAAATPAAPPTQVTNVTVDGPNIDLGAVDLVGQPGAPTGLLALKPDGGGDDLFAYCVQIGTNEGKRHTPMHHAPWAQYPDPNSAFKSDSGKVNWILHNSYPTAKLDDLAKAAGTSTLSVTEAVAATQAAIWHFSDNTDLNTSSHRNGANVKALYLYLTTGAVDLPQPTDSPTLGITPPARTAGAAGTEIGPFVINTTLQLLQLSLTVSPGGTLKIVDVAGHQVDANKVVNGDRVFFHVPAGTAAGTGSFHVSGGLQVGQMFVGDGIQTLILAQTSMLTAASGGNWVSQSSAPSSTPAVTTNGSGGTLPNTGVSVQAPIVLSIVLIGAGSAFLLVQRRRKRA